jgi:hypothetical protein
MPDKGIVSISEGNQARVFTKYENPDMLSPSAKNIKVLGVFAGSLEGTNKNLLFALPAVAPDELLSRELESALYDHTDFLRVPYPTTQSYPG